MAVNRYTPTQAAKAVISTRKAIVTWENERLNALKYDKPCGTKEDEEHIGLFLLWCVSKLDHYTGTDQKELIISKLNRFGGNSRYTVTDEEAELFLLTDFGLQITDDL